MVLGVVTAEVKNASGSSSSGKPPRPEETSGGSPRQHTFTNAALVIPQRYAGMTDGSQHHAEKWSAPSSRGSDAPGRSQQSHVPAPPPRGKQLEKKGPQMTSREGCDDLTAREVGDSEFVSMPAPDPSVEALRSKAHGMTRNTLGRELSPRSIPSSDPQLPKPHTEVNDPPARPAPALQEALVQYHHRRGFTTAKRGIEQTEEVAGGQVFAVRKPEGSSERVAADAAFFEYRKPKVLMRSWNTQSEGVTNSPDAGASTEYSNSGRQSVEKRQLAPSVAAFQMPNETSPRSTSPRLPMGSPPRPPKEPRARRHSTPKFRDMLQSCVEKIQLTNPCDESDAQPSPQKLQDGDDDGGRSLSPSRSPRVKLTDRSVDPKVRKREAEARHRDQVSREAAASLRRLQRFHTADAGYAEKRKQQRAESDEKKLQKRRETLDPSAAARVGTIVKRVVDTTVEKMGGLPSLQRHHKHVTSPRSAAETARITFASAPPPRDPSGVFRVMEDCRSPLRVGQGADWTEAAERSQRRAQEVAHSNAIKLLYRAASHTITAPPTMTQCALPGTCRPSYASRHFLTNCRNALGRTTSSTEEDIVAPNLRYVHPPRPAAFGSETARKARRGSRRRVAGDDVDFDVVADVIEVAVAERRVIAEERARDRDEQ